MQNLYRRGMPVRTFDETVSDVLRLQPREFAQFQQVARHYLGEHHFHDALVQPKNKILPSSLETIRDVDSPSTLAALMHVEKGAHDDPKSNYHMGGGLHETAVSIFSGLWNMIGFGPEFNQLYNYLGWSKNKKQPDELDRYYAHIVDESYTNPTNRDEQISNWWRNKQLDTKYFSTWVDEENDRIHVALKGTSSGKDFMSDLHILGTNYSGHENRVLEYLEQVAELYPHSHLDVSGHSLGGRELINVFIDHADNADLQRYERINLFAPGTTPTHNLANSQQILHDPRVHLYLNNGDMLSNTFTSLVPSDYENVIWADPHHSPSWNHGMQQWRGENV